jgi:hypothetical protein
VAVAAVITAVPVVLANDGPADQRLVPIAVAADGELSCGGGFAEAILPTEAEIRLLPAALPERWSLQQVFAREERGWGWCGVPHSLVALESDARGTVTGAIRVLGPLPRVEQAEDAVSDVVAGRPAQRYSGSDPAVQWVRWWWTDERGQHWSAEVDGYAVERAREVLSAIDTDGDRVAWNAQQAPGFDVVHHRTGGAYAPMGERLAWYLQFSDGTAKRAFDVQRTDRSEEPSVVAEAFPGQRLVTVAGHPAVISPPEITWFDGDDHGPIEEVLAVQLGPGTQLHTTVRGDLPAVQALVGSLEDVPVTDRRLVDLALEE